MDSSLQTGTPEAPEPALKTEVSPAGNVPPGAAKPSRLRRFGGKKLLVAGAAVFVLAGAAAAYTFGYYLPNKPENIYATALSRTGEGYDTLASYLKNAETAKKFENTQVSGDFRYKSASFSTDGTFEVKESGQDSTFKADLGALTTRLKLEGVVKDAANSESPDVYLKASGIKGLEEYLPGLDSLDGQWMMVDHSLLDTLAGAYAKSDEAGLSLPPQKSMHEAYDVLGRVARKYVFIDNENSVFKLSEYVGKEKSEGQDTFHYKVGINKSNYKKFITELGSELDKTQLSKWAKDNYGKRPSELLNTKDLSKAADNLKDSDTAGLWVDAKTKLVHKVRVTEKDSSKNFIEFGLNYREDGKYPFFMKSQSVDEKFELTATLDSKSHKIKVAGKLETGKGSDASTVSINMDIQPGSGQAVKAPSGAISLNEALAKVNLDDYVDAITQSLESGEAPASPLEGVEGTELEGLTQSDLESLYNLQ